MSYETIMFILIHTSIGALGAAGLLRNYIVSVSNMDNSLTTCVQQVCLLRHEAFFACVATWAAIGIFFLAVDSISIDFKWCPTVVCAG
eukprot:2954553-Pleurochrysis_carterae.AAC.1